MIIRTPLIAAGAVVLALGVAACSSDDNGDTAAATTTAAAAATTTSANTSASAAAGAVPEAADLDAVFVKFFDPALPAADKALLIEDGTEQVAVLEQFNGVLQGYPLSGEVTKVVAVDDDTVTATTTIGGPHGGAPVDVTFDENDGTWVISEDAACQILGMGRLTCVQ